tara:strand:+ start:2594 stop:2947 length:354 start_codon:yes stop_codon:yes gene_type:complete
MEISLLPALLLYFSGIVTYAFAIRIFGIYTKTLFYKLAYVNSLAILKFADGLSQDLINNCDEKDPEITSQAFEHWRLLALYSLRCCMPDSVWSEMGTLEWRQAMRLLDSLEEKKEQS